MKSRTSLQTEALALVLIGLGYGTSASSGEEAAEASSIVLQEVTVTAQKREQALSDVGISATAYTADQLRSFGVSSTQDLARVAPGLDVTGYGNGALTVFAIRGASQLSFDDQNEAPVAVYLDGAYISFLSGVGFNFYDLDRVEVLRGSQGTLFGRNATGGVVQILSKKPTDLFEGYAEVTAGSYDERKFEGALNVPFSDTAKARFSFFREKNDGYVKNLTRPGQDHYDKDNVSGRAQLLLEPSENLSIHLAGRASVDDANSEAFYTLPIALNSEGMLTIGDAASHFAYCSPGGGFNRGTATPILGATDCYGYFRAQPGNPFVVENNYPTGFKRDLFGSTATVDYKVGDWTITSVTDWQDLRKRYKGDSDTSPFTRFHFFQDLDGEQVSEELRLAVQTNRTRWTTGLYYLSIDTDGHAGVDGIGVLGVSLDNLYALKTKSYAAFGQMEYDITPSLTAIIGGRWTEDKKTFVFTPRCTFSPALQDLSSATCFAIFGSGFVHGTGLPKTSNKQGNWSGNVELDWHARDGQLVYGKITRGHKGGGFNGGILAFFPLDEATYGPELPLTYEAGFKSDLFGGRARTSISAFYTDYKDFQTFYSRPGNILTIFNVDAEVLGSEIELLASPWQGWDFMLGVSLLDAKQKDLAFNGITRDRPMPDAPDVSFNALVRREWAAPVGRVALQVDTSYKGERTMGAIDHPAMTSDAYALWNASVEWRSATDKLSVKLSGTNLGDKVYFPRIFTGTAGSMQYVVGEPRMYYATVRYDW